MAEFELSARATLDASRFQAGAKTVEASVRAVETATRATGPAATKTATDMDGLRRAFQAVAAGAKEAKREADALALANQKLDAAAARLRAQLDPVAAAQERVNAEMREAKQLFDSGRISAEQYARATGLIQKGQLGVTTSAGQMRAATLNAGRQVQDITMQAALGANGFQILAQQGGQVADAMSTMGGRVGMVARALAGPVGSLLIAGVSVVGMMLTMRSSTNDASKAKKSFTDASDAAKMSSDELTKAIDEQNKALGRSLQTQRDAEKQALRNAEIFFNEAKERREATVETLAYARAIQRANIARATGPGANSDVAAMALAGGNERIAEIERELADAVGRERRAGQGIAAARLKLLQRNVAEANTPEGKANRLLQTQTENLNRQYAERLRRGENVATVERAYQAALLKATQERDAEVERIRERAKEEKKKPGAPKLPEVTQSEVIRILKETFGGGTATSGRRSVEENRRVGGDPNSFHLTGNAVDFVPRGGVGRFDKAKARAALLAAGIDIKELLGPGDSGHADHGHVAFGRRRLGPDQVSNQLARDEVRRTREREREDQEERARVEGLKRDYEALGKALDPVIAAQNDFIEQLKRIDRLQAAGVLGFGEATELTIAAGAKLGEARLKRDEGLISPEAQAETEEFFRDLGKEFGIEAKTAAKELAEQIEEAARQFRSEIRRSANELGEAIGGSVGRLVSSLTAAVVAIKSGENPRNNRVSAGLGAAKDLNESLGKLFGKNGELVKGLGKTLEAAGVGAAIGDATADVAKLLGFKKYSRTGAQVGGAIGGAVGGPLGAAVGSVIGGVGGSFLKKTKTGVATVSGFDDDPRLSGNSKSARKEAGAIGTAIQDSLRGIAERLGGELGSFNVSIGTRAGKFRVDPSGRGQTKKKRGAKNFGDDADAALRFAIGDAIADGAIQGLSTAVRAALGSSKDLDRALNEALKVQAIEDLVGGIGGKLARSFKDFDRVANERVKLAKKYGLDLIAVEKANAEERAALVKNLIQSRIGSLLDFQKDLKFGDLFEGDAATRRNAILAEIGTTQKRAEAGSEGAADELVSLYRRLIGTSEEAFGTAGPELAADRAAASAAIERVIQLENERIAAAQAAQAAQLDEAKKNNELTDETNNLVAGTNARLDRLIEKLGLQGATSPPVDYTQTTGRFADLHVRQVADGF